MKMIKSLDLTSLLVIICKGRLRYIKGDESYIVVPILIFMIIFFVFYTI